MTIAASGNYVGGAMWPPVIDWGIRSIGWRATHIAIGSSARSRCVALVRCASRWRREPRSHSNAPPPRLDLRLSTNALTTLLAIAGIACCVAMSMPQVHIVAYCGDLGYGVAHGAEMLSLMLGFGIVSRSARVSRR